MSNPRKIILDTDLAIGIPGTDADDPIALMLSVKDPRLELAGVTTTFGNCPPELGARCATAVLTAAGRRDVPVAIGLSTQIGGGLLPPLAEAYGGARGRPGSIPLPDLADSHIGQHAVDFIIETVLANPREVTVVAIGPQSNLALALVKEPRLRRELASVVFMGGALGLDPKFGRGNITPVAECNVWFDPQAADIVFRSGLDLTMVGLDVTNPTMGMVLSGERIRELGPGPTALGRLFHKVCASYLEAPMFDWADGCVLYDPLAVAISANEGIASFEPMAVGVETGGRLSKGQTVPLRNADVNMKVCVHVEGASAVDEIVTRILAP